MPAKKSRQPRPLVAIARRLIRLPLKAIPSRRVVPVLSGPARGLRWITGSATHGCWIGSYEWRHQRIFARLVRQGDIVFDIGANVGFYTLLAARLVAPGGVVHSFEPLERNLQFLRRHCEINRTTNVTIHALALADSSGTERFSERRNPAMGALSNDGNLVVSTVMLDQLWRSGEVPEPDLLKIDVEGAEVRVLTGAERTLRECRPAILLSAHGYRRRDECVAFLLAIGYDVEFLLEDRTEGNYELLFIHRNREGKEGQ